MDKKKVLFVVSDFFQHGAQREMYEIDKALNKDRFQVALLSLAPLNSRADIFDYYYQKHLELNSKIIFNQEIIIQNRSLLFRTVNKLTSNYLKNKENETNTSKLKAFFDTFDRVIFMGEYTYQKLSKNIPVDYFTELLVFIMSSRFQSENFRDFNKNNNYTFIGGFEQAHLAYEFEGFSHYKNCYIPLALEVSKEFNKWHYHNNKVKKIGIFTRLNTDKPLDPFFYAFQILLKQTLNIELHIFGGGDYKKAGYDRYLNNLDIVDKVFFRGHQIDMKQTILEEKIDLIWFQGYNSLPAGYAALEVSLTGVPQLFWDFFPGKNDSINSTEVVYPHFKDVLSFVDASNNILFNEQDANELSTKQFHDVYYNRDITKYIDVIHNLLNTDVR